MRIAGVLRRATGLLLLLGLSACGPGRAASTGSSESESSSSESGDPITTGSNDESDEAETDDPSGPNIIPYPDAFCSAAGGFYCTPSCDPLAQDCPEGEKCTPFASTGGTWDDYKCVPVLGELGPGESCTYDDPVLATDDCGSTSMCYDGVCRSFCKPPYDTPACPVGYGCADVGMTEGRSCVSPVATRSRKTARSAAAMATRTASFCASPPVRWASAKLVDSSTIA